MTIRGSNIRHWAEEAAQMQQQLQALADEARAALKPGLDQLQQAAKVELADGFAVMDALPPAIHADPTEKAANGAMLEEIMGIVGGITRVFNELGATSPQSQMNAEMARFRIRTAESKLFELTRCETMIEAAPTLDRLRRERPELNRALGQLELAADKTCALLKERSVARAQMTTSKSF